MTKSCILKFRLLGIVVLIIYFLSIFLSFLVLVFCLPMLCCLWNCFFPTTKKKKKKVKNLTCKYFIAQLQNSWFSKKYKTFLLKPKPISVKEKLCYYQLTHTKTLTQNFYKFIKELVAELSMSSRDYFS